MKIYIFIYFCFSLMITNPPNPEIKKHLHVPQQKYGKSNKCLIMVDKLNYTHMCMCVCALVLLQVKNITQVNMPTCCWCCCCSYSRSCSWSWSWKANVSFSRCFAIWRSDANWTQCWYNFPVPGCRCDSLFSFHAKCSALQWKRAARKPYKYMYESNEYSI